jgi:hypothetical protein
MFQKQVPCHQGTREVSQPQHAAIESKQRSAPRGGDWRRGIRSRVRGPTLRQLQKRAMLPVQQTHGTYLPLSSPPRFGFRSCNRRHKLLSEYPIIFWTTSARRDAQLGKQKVKNLRTD